MIIKCFYSWNRADAKDIIFMCNIWLTVMVDLKKKNTHSPLVNEYFRARGKFTVSYSVSVCLYVEFLYDLRVGLLGLTGTMLIGAD